MFSPKVRNHCGALIKKFLMFSQAFETHVTTLLTAVLIQSTTLFQASMHQLRKSSFVFHSTTRAATRAATAVMTMPIGFAASTTFKAAWATVAPSLASWKALIASTRPMTIDVTFQATKAAPIAARTAAIVLPFSETKLKNSFILSATAWILSPTDSQSMFAMKSWSFAASSSIVGARAWARLFFTLSPASLTLSIASWTLLSESSEDSSRT